MFDDVKEGCLIICNIFKVKQHWFGGGIKEKDYKCSNSEVCKWRQDSDKTQKNKPEWRTILLKHFPKKLVFLKHFFWNKNFV